MNYMNLIFGNETDENNNALDLRSGLDQSFIQYLEEQEDAFKRSVQYGTDNHNKTAGLFNFHVGYAPVMDEDHPEEVKTKGYGEFGRVSRTVHDSAGPAVPRHLPP